MRLIVPTKSAKWEVNKLFWDQLILSFSFFAPVAFWLVQIECANEDVMPTDAIIFKYKKYNTKAYKHYLLSDVTLTDDHFTLGICKVSVKLYATPNTKPTLCMGF